MKLTRNNAVYFQGPVVQSIASLTILLRRQLVWYRSIKYTVMLCGRQVKHFHIFHSKKYKSIFKSNTKLNCR